MNQPTEISICLEGWGVPKRASSSLTYPRLGPLLRRTSSYAQLWPSLEQVPQDGRHPSPVKLGLSTITKVQEGPSTFELSLPAYDAGYSFLLWQAGFITRQIDRRPIWWTFYVGWVGIWLPGEIYWSSHRRQRRCSSTWTRQNTKVRCRIASRSKVGWERFKVQRMVVLNGGYGCQNCAAHRQTL